MKIKIKRMYDAIKAIEVEELKKKLEAIGGRYEFEDPYVLIEYDDSDMNTHEVLVEEVFIENGNVFLLVRDDETCENGIRIDSECVRYCHLACVTDEIQYPRSVWMRIGCTVRGTKEQMDTMLRGEDYRLAEYTLKDMLNNGQIDIDGSCYIPEKCVEDYNEEYGDDVEVGDIDFG
jgi:hypothetical protein